MYENIIDVCDGIAGVDDVLDSLQQALDTFDSAVADCGDSSGSGGDIVSSDDCSDAIQDLSNCTNVVVHTCTVIQEIIYFFFFFANVGH